MSTLSLCQHWSHSHRRAPASPPAPRRRTRPVYAIDYHLDVVSSTAASHLPRGEGSTERFSEPKFHVVHLNIEHALKASIAINVVSGTDKIRHYLIYLIS